MAGRKDGFAFLAARNNATPKAMPKSAATERHGFQEVIVLGSGFSDRAIPLSKTLLSLFPLASSAIKTSQDTSTL